MSLETFKDEVRKSLAQVQRDRDSGTDSGAQKIVQTLLGELSEDPQYEIIFGANTKPIGDGLDESAHRPLQQWSRRNDVAVQSVVSHSVFRDEAEGNFGLHFGFVWTHLELEEGVHEFAFPKTVEALREKSILASADAGDRPETIREYGANTIQFFTISSPDYIIPDLAVSGPGTMAPHVDPEEEQIVDTKWFFLHQRWTEAEEAGDDPAMTIAAELRDELGALAGGTGAWRAAFHPTPTAGIDNEGLVASHYLFERVPERDDWASAGEQARQILDGLDGTEELFDKLGYELEPARGERTFFVRSKDGGEERAVAVFIERDESFYEELERFGDETAPNHALDIAEEEGIEHVVGHGGQSLRLYSSGFDTGVGSRSRAETFIELNLELLSEEDAAYLLLLFSDEALAEGGIFEELSSKSADYVADLGDRLRNRVYDEVVPDLAVAVAEARGMQDWDKETLDETHRMALHVLFRLLFIGYCEDEGFLPRDGNDRYAELSLKTKAHRLQEQFEAEGESEHYTLDDSTALWAEIRRLNRAIYEGDEELGLPAYRGRLLSHEPEISDIGAKLGDIELPNRRFAPILRNLLIDEHPGSGERGPVDFQSLGVREFGELYEGLLQSELTQARRDLVIEEKDNKEFYVPADGEEPEVEEGEVYLTGNEGQRKATGTYYTKSLFVEYLLDQSLEPALDDHVERLEELPSEEAAQAFWDFSIADIAMGSAHFLIAAVDRMEARLADLLGRRAENGRPLRAVETELDALERQAQEALPDGVDVEVTRRQLLRRQLARRCLYGVDLNPDATMLARTSVWVHTFVPGIPLTYLDRNLRAGDSLAGVGSFDEVAKALDTNGPQLSFDTFATEETVSEIEALVDEFGRIAEQSASEIEDARKLDTRIARQLAPVDALFDAVSAARLDDELDLRGAVGAKIEKITERLDCNRVEQALDSLDPLHFPTAFPAVFTRDNPGFDVVVGNPPWEEATVEEDEFWTRYRPGLQGESPEEKQRIVRELREQRPDLVREYQQEVERNKKKREMLTSGPYPGMGDGDPDFYKAFCWRFRGVSRNEGDLGVVLPRSVFVTKGSSEFRRSLINESRLRSITFLENRAQWAFDIHPQYSIALVSVRTASVDDAYTIEFRGSYGSRAEFDDGIDRPGAPLASDQLGGYTKAGGFPVLPEPYDETGEVLTQLRKHPSLDMDEKGEWRARPHTELHATNDVTAKDGTQLMHKTEKPPSESFWPVFKGKSFMPQDKVRWVYDTGVRYAWADPDILVDYLQAARERKYGHWNSVFTEMDEEWIHDRSTLPCLNCRVAFQDVGRRTDTRTVRASVIPPKTFLTNKAPYFLWPRGNERDEAYLLGILNSLPLDWYARRFVETNVNYHFLNAFPFPRPGDDEPRRKRVIDIAGRLAARGEPFEEWASAVGVDCGSINEDEELELIYELDAVAAQLYGLDRDQLVTVFETFHDNWNEFDDRVERTLGYHEDWQ